MSYIIDGPTTIGTAAELNEIKGTLQLSDVCTAVGDIIYSSNTDGLMTRLAIGSTGNVLTVAAGVPSWAGFTTAEEGFSARKAATQVENAPFADIIIDDWQTSTAPEFNTVGGDFVEASGIYTAPESGTVNVRAGVSLLSDRNNGLRSLSVQFGGVNVFTTTAQPSGNNAIPLFLSISTSMTLVATNTVNLAFTSTANGGTSTVQATPNTWFSITKNFTP